MHAHASFIIGLPILRYVILDYKSAFNTRLHNCYCRKSRLLVKLKLVVLNNADKHQIRVLTRSRSTAQSIFPGKKVKIVFYSPIIH